MQTVSLLTMPQIASVILDTWPSQLQKQDVVCEKKSHSKQISTTIEKKNVVFLKTSI